MRSGRILFGGTSSRSLLRTNLLRYTEVAAIFYRSPMGAEPVRDWLKSLPLADRKIIGADIQSVEFGWPIGMPLCRSLGGGLWEVRSSITNGIARIFFFLHEREVGHPEWFREEDPENA